MKRLIFKAEGELPANWLEALNVQLESLVRTIEIDFLDSGFYLVTGADSLEVLLSIVSAGPAKLAVIGRGEPSVVLHKTIVLPADAPWEDIEPECRAQIIETTAAYAEGFGCDCRLLNNKAVLIRGEAEGRRRRAEIQANSTEPKETIYDSFEGIEINMKLSDDSFGSASEVDFYLGPFMEKIEELIEKPGLGYIEGNDFGAGFFCLYCEGEPEKMLKAVSKYLISCSKSPEDFVLVAVAGKTREFPLAKMRRTFWGRFMG